MRKIINGYANLAKKQINQLNKDIADLGNNRMNICKKCPKFTNLQTCESCRCYMPSKTLVKSSNCPDGKW